MPPLSTISKVIETLPRALRDCVEAVKRHVTTLGDVEIHEFITRLTFKKHDRRFAHLELRGKDKILIFVGLDRSSVRTEPGFIRTTGFQSQYPQGEVEITIRELSDFERAKALLQRAHAET